MCYEGVLAARKGRLKRKEVDCEERSREMSYDRKHDAVSSFSNIPAYLLDEIINRLERADCVAIAQSVCRDFRESCKRIPSLRIVSTIKFHDEAREGYEPGSLDAGNPHGEGKSGTSDSQDVREGEGGGLTSEQIVPAQQQREPVHFRNLVVDILKNKRHLVQLRIEIDSKLQAKAVPEGERRRTDHWLSDPNHQNKWIPSVQDTLQHLCIVDYGQQAIMRRTSIFKILSESCKVLQTLDLRSVFIDTENCEDMTSLTSLTSPEKLSINAPALKYIAFNLEVQDATILDVKNIHSLQEVLYGASSFTTLSSLVKTRLDLDKEFLDMPCMALGEDGNWLGVLKDVLLDLPDFSQLHERKKLDVLNVGPGLWYSMDELEKVKWPNSSVTTLQIYVDTSSPIEYHLIIPKVEEMLSYHQAPDCIFKPNPWTKSLDFSCFSF